MCGRRVGKHSKDVKLGVLSVNIKECQADGQTEQECYVRCTVTDRLTNSAYPATALVRLAAPSPDWERRAAPWYETPRCSHLYSVPLRPLRTAENRSSFSCCYQAHLVLLSAAATSAAAVSDATPSAGTPSCACGGWVRQLERRGRVERSRGGGGIGGDARSRGDGESVGMDSRSAVL